MTPTTGPLDGDVMIRAVAALFDKTGPGILVRLRCGSIHISSGVRRDLPLTEKKTQLFAAALSNAVAFGVGAV